MVNIVIFGATGDLTKRKLLPALYSMYEKGVLKEGKIIAVGRRLFDTKQYLSFLSESMSENTRKLIETLPLQYVSCEFSRAEEVSALREMLGNEEMIFYLATSYKLFPAIVSGLKQAGLVNTRTKIVFEKPFGDNVESFMELERKIHEVFTGEQIFRIDHYLAKETVQNLLVLRRSNSIIERLLCGECVDKIEVIVDEELGVGERLGYYHEVGALKDIVQNHMLQILSLILLELPESLLSESIHTAKLAALKELYLLPPSEQMLGQYESYKDEVEEAGLDARKTETFVKLQLASSSPRWQGSKFILRTGKKLKEKRGKIEITFKGYNKNRLVIDIYPRQDIVLYINTRKPDSKDEIEQVPFIFSAEKHFGPNTVDEYSVLLEEVLQGNHSLFPTAAELEAAWKLIESVEEIKEHIPFLFYEDGSEPEQD